jgi:ketosteroid isomerase-like protein
MSVTLVKLISALLILASTNGADPQRRTSTGPTTTATASRTQASLTGLYRINVGDSDRLYSVVSGASSNLPYRDQQRFFIDLAVRLTPPDQFSIEQQGKNISVASSRAPRITFNADGKTHVETSASGHPVRTRAVVEGPKLEVTTDGSTNDKFSVSFEPVNQGAQLRVVRRIYAEELNEPVIITSVYDKVSDVARWEIYGEPENASVPKSASVSRPDRERATSESASNADVEALRSNLDSWIEATNRRDIPAQLQYYSPTLRAYYLKRDVPLSAVRSEKERVFRQAQHVDVRAAAPEIVFANNGQIAIMRYRKTYNIRNGKTARSGEVIQELRWQRSNGEWKIFSERDVKVLN